MCQGLDASAYGPPRAAHRSCPSPHSCLGAASWCECQDLDCVLSQQVPPHIVNLMPVSRCVMDHTPLPLSEHQMPRRLSMPASIPAKGPCCPAQPQLQHGSFAHLNPLPWQQHSWHLVQSSFCIRCAGSAPLSPCLCLHCPSCRLDSYACSKHSLCICIPRLLVGLMGGVKLDIMHGQAWPALCMLCMLCCQDLDLTKIESRPGPRHQ